MKFQRVKDLREDMELNQFEVAKVLNITKQQYSLYETGKRTFPVQLLLKLSEFYNVSIDYLTSIRD